MTMYKHEGTTLYVVFTFHVQHLHSSQLHTSTVLFQHQLTADFSEMHQITKFEH